MVINLYGQKDNQYLVQWLWLTGLCSLHPLACIPVSPRVTRTSLLWNLWRGSADEVMQNTLEVLLLKNYI